MMEKIRDGTIKQSDIKPAIDTTDIEIRKIFEHPQKAVEIAKQIERDTDINTDTRTFESANSRSQRDFHTPISTLQTPEPEPRRAFTRKPKAEEEEKEPVKVKDEPKQLWERAFDFFVPKPQAKPQVKREEHLQQLTDIRDALKEYKEEMTEMIKEEPTTKSEAITREQRAIEMAHKVEQEVNKLKEEDVHKLHERIHQHAPKQEEKEEEGDIATIIHLASTEELYQCMAELAKEDRDYENNPVWIQLNNEANRRIAEQSKETENDIEPSTIGGLSSVITSQSDIDTIKHHMGFSHLGKVLVANPCNTDGSVLKYFWATDAKHKSTEFTDFYGSSLNSDNSNSMKHQSWLVLNNVYKMANVTTKKEREKAQEIATKALKQTLKFQFIPINTTDEKVLAQYQKILGVDIHPMLRGHGKKTHLRK